MGLLDFIVDAAQIITHVVDSIDNDDEYVLSLFQKNKSVVQSFFELPTSFCSGVSAELYAFDQRNGVGGHAFFAADEAHALTCGGFQRDRIEIHAQ